MCGRLIHQAIDYLFCDRCPCEVIDSRISKCAEVICIWSWLWPHIPKEPFDANHPIRWPRSWMGTVLEDVGLQKVGERKYGAD